MNNRDTNHHPYMKTAVSSFRFERSTLKKRLDKYQEQHSKTLRNIAQNQRELTRSLSSESEQSADKHDLLHRRRACSLYGSEYGESFAVGDEKHSVCDSTMLYNKHELPLSSPAKTPTNGKLTAASSLPPKPTSSSFVTRRFCSSARSSSVANCKPTHDKSKKVLKRQARVENIQESEVQRNLVEQTKTIIITDRERSLRSSKVNKDAFKDQKHDKYEMNLTEKSQQTADKRAMNSFHEYESKTTKQNDKEKSFLNLFKNKKPLPSVSKQYANSFSATKPRDNHAIKSVDDISRTFIEPASFIIKQSLRPTKSLSPISTSTAVFNKQRSKTFAGETEIQYSHSENLLARKQVDEETKNVNPNEQHLKRWHRNAWSEMDDNYMVKSTAYKPSLKTSLIKPSDVEEHLSNSEKDKIVLDSTEMKEKRAIKCHEAPASETRGDRSETVANHCKEISKEKLILLETVNDHVMHRTVAANHKSEGNLDADCHLSNQKDTKRNKLGNGSEDNLDLRDNKALQKTTVLEPQSKGWRKLRALPLRLKQIREIGEAERKRPVLQDFKVRDTSLQDRPGSMSFRQVVFAAIKKDEEQSKKKKSLISKERLNEIQQPTESFLRQIIDKKIMHYTAHAPRPSTEERSKRGPEFHAIARGIQGFHTLSSVANATRLLRAEKIRKKSSLPYTRTQDLMADRQKTISEMMDEVKNCRYLRNKECHMTMSHDLEDNVT